MNDKALIDKADYIFFDFFDTIVHRDVNEIYILEKWAKLLSVQLAYAVEPEVLYDLRKKATRIVLKKEGTEEPNYYSIIKELYGLLHCSLPGVDFEDFLKFSERTELDLEKRVLNLDLGCKKLIDYARSTNKKIFIISDFYFGKKYLEELLETVGINGKIFTNIYVSCEYAKKKETGNLYKVVIDENSLEPQKCLMIGDNEKADILMAKANGFEVLHRPYHAVETIDIFDGLKRIRKEYKKYPFAGYAFGFYRFIDLLYKESIRNNYTTLLFLSREGYILKKFFDTYQNNLEKKIKTEYLYVSRFSTFLPSLKALNEEKFDVIFDQYGDISVRSFLKNLHFTNQEIEEVTNSGEDIDEVVKAFGKSSMFEKLKENPQFKETYKEKVTKAHENFKGYFESVVGSQANPVVLVDVGWKGTMQDNLYKIFKDKNEFVGLYFGIFNETGMECASNIKKGLVFNKYPYKSENYDVWEFETHLIEQLMVAPHGSTVDYVNENGTIIPQLDWTEEDRKLYYLAEPIQEHITKCFEDICTLLENRCVPEKKLKRFITEEQLRAELILSNQMISFEKVALSEKTNNFGWFDKIPRAISKKEKLYHLIKDLKNIASDVESKSTLKYLHYFAVKMNARESYNWKKMVYKVFYYIEKNRL